jgi:hypothetical protein
VEQSTNGSVHSAASCCMVAQSGWLVGVARSAQEESAAPIHGFIIVMSCFTPADGASSFSIPLYWLCYTYRSVCTKERKKKGAWPHREPNRWALSRSDGLMFSGGRGSCRRVTARQLALPERQQQHANPLPTHLQLGEADVRMSPSQFGEA